MPMDACRCRGRKSLRIAIAMLISNAYGIPGRVQLIYDAVSSGNGKTDTSGPEGAS